jgi:hypothetical protein
MAGQAGLSAAERLVIHFHLLAMAKIKMGPGYTSHSAVRSRRDDRKVSAS